MDCTKATRHRCQTSAVNRTPTTTARAAQATRYATGSHSLYFNLHLVFSLQGYYPADQGQEDYWQQQPQQHGHQPTYHDQGWGAPQQAASGFPPYPDYGFALFNLSLSMVFGNFFCVLQTCSFVPAARLGLRFCSTRSQPLVGTVVAPSSGEHVSSSGAASGVVPEPGVELWARFASRPALSTAAPAVPPASEKVRGGGAPIGA